MGFPSFFCSDQTSTKQTHHFHFSCPIQLKQLKLRATSLKLNLVGGQSQWMGLVQLLISFCVQQSENHIFYALENYYIRWNQRDRFKSGGLGSWNREFLLHQIQAVPVIAPSKLQKPPALNQTDGGCSLRVQSQREQGSDVLTWKALSEVRAELLPFILWLWCHFWWQHQAKSRWCSYTGVIVEIHLWQAVERQGGWTSNPLRPACSDSTPMADFMLYFAIQLMV